jgi:CoA:oxalate CoA-transferase
MAGPLAGIRVLDISTVFGAPYAASFLGDMGAEVIKVELPGGDVMRQVLGPSFIAMNHSKRFVELNFKTPEGLAALKKIAATCDVFIENGRPGKAEKWGYGYEDLKEVRSDIIYCSVSAYGRTGPYAQWAAVDYNIQAMSGAMSFTGPMGGPPTKLGPMAGDFPVMAFACWGITLALMHRMKTGEGQRVDLSLFDCALHLIGNRVQEWLIKGKKLRPNGTRHPSVVPQQIFETRDGKPFAVNIQDPWRWEAFCKGIGKPEFVNDPRTKDNDARYANAEFVYKMMEDVFRTKTLAEWVKFTADYDQHFSPMLNIEEVVEDPQVKHNNMLPEFPNRQLGKVKFWGLPVHLSASPGQIKGGPGELGEHTDEVLKEVGVGAAEIAKLRESGVIPTHEALQKLGAMR